MTVWVGLLAATFTTLAFVPQVVKTWRTKSAADLSIGTFAMFCLGVALWLVYGVLQRDLPIILANVVTLVLALAILVQALVFRRRSAPRSESF